MKRLISMIISVTLLTAMMPFSGLTAVAKTNDAYTINISGVFDYDGAQEMVGYINELRENEGLAALSLDTELTEAAKQRAAEIAYYMSHTRPDESSYISICPERVVGENIASGNSTAIEAFNQWSDSQEDYENLIDSSFTNTGIGHFTHNGVDFWVQLFSSDDTKAIETRTGTVETKVKISVIENSQSSINFGTFVPIQLLQGETFQLVANADNAMLTGTSCNIDADSFIWSSSDETIATVSEEGIVTAVNGGTATITATINNGSGTKVSIDVEITRDISDLVEVEIKKWDYSTYDSALTCIEENLVVSLEGKVLQIGTDYNIPTLYTNKEEQKITAFDIMFLGVYSGVVMMTSLDDVYIDPIPNQIYTGTEIKPSLKVYLEKSILVEGTDFSVEYENNIEPGTATIKILPLNHNYGYAEFNFCICKNIADTKVTVLTSTEYTGEVIEPTFEIVYQDIILAEGIDYEVTYSDNQNIGTATAVIQGIGEYSGSIVTHFQITRKNVTNLVTWKLDTVDVTGYISGYECVRNNLHLEVDGTPLEEEKDYSISFVASATEAKKITAFEILFEGNYEGILRVESLDNINVNVSDSYHYTGKAISPELTGLVKNRYGEEMKEGKDYIADFVDNESPGIATIKFVGIGNYFGTTEKKFTITDHDYQLADEIQPTCTTAGKKIFTCSYEGCNAGKTELIPAEGHTSINLKAVAPTCTKQGLTEGKECSACGKILKAQEEIAMLPHKPSKTETTKATLSSDGKITKSCTCGKVLSTKVIYKTKNIKLSYDQKVYTGEFLKAPVLTVTDRAGNTMKKGTDYTVTGLTKKKAVGKYKVTVTFIGKYSGTKQLYFTIVPKKPAKAKAKLYGYDDVKFSWSKVIGASGYLVYYKKVSSSKWSKAVATTKAYYKKADLADGTKYTFKVIPYYKTNSSKKKYYSEEQYKSVSIYTLKKISKPVVTKSGTKVKVSWNNINGETGYQISKSIKKNGTNIIVKQYNTTSGTYKKISVEKNKKYYYKVRAYKIVDGKKICGPWSEVEDYKRI